VTSGGRRYGLVARIGVVVFGLLLASAGVARGQDQAGEGPPVPPDSARGDAAADTVAATPADTTAGAQPDSFPPPPELVSFPEPDLAGWTAGVWEWTREDLLESGALTLADLLEQLPGVTPVRSGLVGLPVGASAFGATGGRLHIVLDGFELDPLGSSTFDLARLELGQLRRVRVERRLDGLRIELETIAPFDPRPYTLVEAGTGQLLASNMFRGTFLAPRFIGRPMGLGIEYLDTRRTSLTPEAASSFSAWFKWGILSKERGLQLEVRRSNMKRSGVSALAGEGSRQDWVLRGRNAFSPNFVAEAYIGQSSNDDGFGETKVRESSFQTGLRAMYRAERLWAGGAVRTRSHASFPPVEAELEVGGRPLPFLQLSGDVAWANWREAGRAAAVTVRSELGPFAGLRAFGELSAGDEGVPFVAYDGTRAVVTSRDALRFGGEWSRGDFQAGAARVRLRTDGIPTFGLPFDRTPGIYPGGEVQGWELTARVPLFWKPLSLEGWYTRWEGNRWIYLPDESWRAGLVYHHLPLKSGNLEILARIEARYRGAMLVPDTEGGASLVPGVTTLDGYLHIRIVGVRGFLRWENMTRLQNVYDLPGRNLPGPRFFYGIKWELWD
jgi:hypothetical protein